LTAFDFSRRCEVNQSVQIADIQRIAEDTRLSLEGKALMVYLATRPAGYKLTMPDLVSLTAQARFTAGEKTIYNRLNELISFGYVTRKLVQRGADYFVHVVPLPPTEGEAATVTTGEAQQ
jgi:hypothetical protein